MMKEISVSVPKLAAIAGTRAALGAGIGLLLSDYLDFKQRRSLGWMLVMLGVISTVPLAVGVFGKALGTSGTETS